MCMSPYFSGFLLQSDRLKQARTIETARWDLVKGDRDRLIEVAAIIKGHNFRDFDRLIRCRLIKVRLHILMAFSLGRCVRVGHDRFDLTSCW